MTATDRASFQRLLRPRSIAVIGGGGWCANVIEQCRKIGFQGDIRPVHPTRCEVGGLAAVASVTDLSEPPDAAFIGVNRTATVDVVRQLSQSGCGGAVCFASGFREAQAELSDGADLQAALLEAAGDMRVLGPNCYGFVNALDGAALWPDQHGMPPVDSGVAILTQSSNIALNLTMQQRGVPIAYLGTVGNQAQVDLAAFGMAVLEDPRVTALGLHIEGISDVRSFEALTSRAYELGKRIVAIKVGASEQASMAAVSHTASLAGSDAGARAFLARLGIAQVASLDGMLEALKILHCIGPLPHGALGSMSCSGGEASLMADSVLGTGLHFPALGAGQKSALRDALGEKVALANPLDYHTYIWADLNGMTGCFSAMMANTDLALGIVVLDFPRPDRCGSSEWGIALEAIEAAARASGKPMAVLASLPENLPEDVALDLMSRGIVPLCGIGAALEGISAAVWLGRHRPAGDPVALPETGEGALPPSAAQPPPGYLDQEKAGLVLPEAEAKGVLAACGLPVPAARRVSTPQEAGDAAAGIGYPVVLKGEGFAHKTEAGAVRLGLQDRASVMDAAERMGATGYLVEQMVPDTVAEVLVGVTRDPAHGFVLTMGAGGVLTEILRDTVSLLLPVSGDEIGAALQGLQIAPVLAGYRGQDAADTTAIVRAVLAVQDYVVENAGKVQEVEINPLLCGPSGAVAVDALIRLEE